MNAGEAEKCLSLSKNKYHAGDLEGAKRFAQKALKLDSSSSNIKEWIAYMEKSKRTPTARPAASKEREEPPVVNRQPYTAEHEKGIRRILEMKKKGDLYGIFGLEKGCTDNEIKKAYRKAALLYHPDKCGAPGTDDAFKAIGHAWTVLGDPDKKGNYDRFGVDSEAPNNGRGGGGGNPFAAQGFQGFGGHPGFEGELSPEDILRMFMGGGAFGGGPQFSFNTGGFGGGPQFRTRTNFQQNQRRRTYDYSLEKSTPNHNVQYFVNPRNYERRFNTVRRQSELNNRVDSDYYQHLRMKCQQEKETRAYYIRQATNWFAVDQDRLQKAQGMPMPACDGVNTWYRK